MKLFRKIKNIFSKKKVDFNDPISKDFISNDCIPEVVLENNVGLYNYGYNEKTNKYKVLVFPLPNLEV